MVRYMNLQLYCQLIFQSAGPCSYSHQQWTRVPMPPFLTNRGVARGVWAPGRHGQCVVAWKEMLSHPPSWAPWSVVTEALQLNFSDAQKRGVALVSLSRGRCSPAPEIVGLLKLLSSSAVLSHHGFICISLITKMIGYTCILVIWISFF